MKDHAIDIVSRRTDPADGLNLLREYLQSRILGVMQEAGAMVPLAFRGDTALRFIYRIPRYSEDLDFTVERHPEGFGLRALSSRIERRLQDEGYTTCVGISDSRAVAKAMVGFVGLPAEAGLSPHADQVLWVKIEVDTTPPVGAGLAVSVVRCVRPLRGWSTRSTRIGEAPSEVDSSMWIGRMRGAMSLPSSSRDGT